MQDMDALAKTYPGWSLSEIRDLSRRERSNWLEINYPREAE